MMAGKTDKIPLLVALAKKYQASTIQIALK